MLPGGNALPGLLAAAFWGVGDFSGGMGVKRAGGTAGAALRVVLLSHVTSFSVLFVLGLSVGGPFPHGRLLAWGLAAGVAAGLSLSAFYVALSRGAMGTSAALSGLLAAAIPAAVSLGVDGGAGGMRYAGFAVAGLAIWLIAAGGGAREKLSTVLLAVGAGMGFGLYFVALKFAGASGLVWPMATARMGSIAACSVILLAFRGGGSAVITRSVFLWVLLTAVFDTSGNLFFIAATRAGRLDVAAVLASLYPASTIALAAIVLQEKMTRRQWLGIAVAVAAVVLVTL